MIKLRAAPLIHARTKYIDFRSKFITVPENFSNEKIQWAQKYIYNSTRYMEYIDTSWRELIVSNGEECLVGITIDIPTLFSKCGEVPECTEDTNKRSVYGFIGLVFNREENPDIPLFTIPFHIYLDLYKQCVCPRWEENLHNAEWQEPSRMAYNIFELPEKSLYDHESLEETVRCNNEKGCSILESSLNDNQEVFTWVLYNILNKKPWAFCSNMPNIKSITESYFNIVTTAHSESILAYLRSNTGSLFSQPELFNEGKQLKEISSIPKKAVKHENQSQKLKALWEKTALDTKQVEKNILGMGDTGIVLGIISGITYILVKGTGNPIIFALIGASTIVLTGIEAIRIKKEFERINKESKEHFSNTSKNMWGMNEQKKISNIDQGNVTEVKKERKKNKYDI